MKAIDLFSKWALSGRDVGMVKNHMPAVQKMLSIILKKPIKNFSFIDIGCGNGYVVREVSKHALCFKSIGIDGSKEMIEKAKKLDPKGKYILSDISIWSPKEKFDYIHSMEVMYYLENPKKTIDFIVKNWLRKGGAMIMGIDFYYENKNCHSWPKDLDVTMNLLTINQWRDIFISSGLNHVKYFQINKKGDFSGTLIISGINSK